MKWAIHFYEIMPTLAVRSDLVQRMTLLVQSEAVLGKAVEGNGREEQMKTILVELVQQKISLEQAYAMTEVQLSRDSSPHRDCNRTFQQNWAHRLVRTQLSRFYNQAVLEVLLEDGQESCYIPHSPHEEGTSKCSVHLAGKEHEMEPMLVALVEAHGKGNWKATTMFVPHHPNCTHVVNPVQRQ